MQDAGKTFDCRFHLLSMTTREQCQTKLMLIKRYAVLTFYN